MAVASEKFSIREFTSRMRSIDVEKCWPFDDSPPSSSKKEIKKEDMINLLPPMSCPQHKWWFNELENIKQQTSQPATNLDLPARDDGLGHAMIKKVTKGKVKKRSIADIFASSSPIINQGNKRELNSTKEKKTNKKKKKKNNTALISQKINKPSEDSSAKFRSSQPVTKRAGKEISDTISIRELKSLCLKSQCRKKHIRTSVSSKLNTKGQKLGQNNSPICRIFKSRVRDTSKQNSPNGCGRHAQSLETPLQQRVSEADKERVASNKLPQAQNTGKVMRETIRESDEITSDSAIALKGNEKDVSVTASEIDFEGERRKCNSEEKCVDLNESFGSSHISQGDYTERPELSNLCSARADSNPSEDFGSPLEAQAIKDFELLPDSVTTKRAVSDHSPKHVAENSRPLFLQDPSMNERKNEKGQFLPSKAGQRTRCSNICQKYSSPYLSQADFMRGMSFMAELKKQRGTLCAENMAFDQDFLGLPMNSQGGWPKLSSRSSDYEVNQLKQQEIGSSRASQMDSFVLPTSPGSAFSTGESHFAERSLPTVWKLSSYQPQGIGSSGLWHDPQKGREHQSFVSDFKSMNISKNNKQVQGTECNEKIVFEDRSDQSSLITTMRLMGKDLTVGRDHHPAAGRSGKAEGSITPPFQALQNPNYSSFAEMKVADSTTQADSCQRNSSNLVRENSFSQQHYFGQALPQPHRSVGIGMGIPQIHPCLPISTSTHINAFQPVLRISAEIRNSQSPSFATNTTFRFPFLQQNQPNHVPSQPIQRFTLIPSLPSISPSISTPLFYRPIVPAPPGFKVSPATTPKYGKQSTMFRPENSENYNLASTARKRTAEKVLQQKQTKGSKKCKPKMQDSSPEVVMLSQAKNPFICSGPIKLAASEKHILKCTPNVDQRNLNPTDLTSALTLETDHGKAIDFPKEPARFYRF